MGSAMGAPIAQIDGSVGDKSAITATLGVG
jgi:hypothetical protein